MHRHRCIMRTFSFFFWSQLKRNNIYSLSQCIVGHSSFKVAPNYNPLPSTSKLSQPSLISCIRHLLYHQNLLLHNRLQLSIQLSPTPSLFHWLRQLVISAVELGSLRGIGQLIRYAPVHSPGKSARSWCWRGLTDHTYCHTAGALANGKFRV